MGLFLSTLLALSQAEPKWPAQAVHHVRLADCWARSRLVCKGMTSRQADAILGVYRCEVFDGSKCFDIYYGYGLWIVVDYDPPTMRVSEVRPTKSGTALAAKPLVWLYDAIDCP